MLDDYMYIHLYCVIHVALTVTCNYKKEMCTFLYKYMHIPL